MRTIASAFLIVRLNPGKVFFGLKLPLAHSRLLPNALTRQDPNAFENKEESMTEAKQLPTANTALWSALQAFQVDEPGTQFTFVKRLAQENHWSITYAQRVFEEYKKFVFLAATAGHQVTPSDEVDQAWHLHLAYTRSYWDELCAQVLQQPLHHGPTRGGKEEGQKYNDWYNRTLASYERIFGAPPPAHIWPTSQIRFAKPQRFARLDTSDYWMIKKLQPITRQQVRVMLAAFLLGLPLAACTTTEVTLSIFLTFGGLCAAMIVAAILNPMWSRSRDQRSDGSGCGGGGCGSSSNDCGDSSTSNCGDSGGGSDGDSGCGSSGCGGGGCGGGGCSS
jgi:hypothetical protein